MKRALVVVAVLLVAACGGKSSGSSSSAAPDASAIATKIGCTGYDGSSTELYVKAGGDCTYNGSDLTIDTFESNTTRDQFLKVAQGFGGTYGEGDRWIIEGDPASAVKAATAAAGGKVAP